MGCKFDELRQELNSLGYRQKLHPECIPLVEKLLADLNTTTTNLQKYMKISQIALEERDNLKLGAEPYKCDNSKLIQECNDLHIAFIHFKEQNEKTQRELRNQISTLQIRLENCNLDKRKIMSQLQQLEKEKYRKASRSGSKEQTIGKENKNFIVSTALASGDANIVRDESFKELKEKYDKVAEDNVVLQNQLATREDEINRLQSLLQGERSFKAVSKDCCYENIDGQIGLLQAEVSRLKREKNETVMQVKDALAKQHEAMRRALHLAERNRQLEKEMRDVDEIALAVETECNNTVKGNTVKVTRLQDRMNESLILIQNLERDNVKLKQDKLKLSADLDAVKLEKIHLQKQLDYEVEDKKRLTDRINNFTIIENDLNLEIDRLTKLTAEQKRKIVELESQFSSDNKSRRDNYHDAEVQGIIEMSEKISQTANKKERSKQINGSKKTTTSKNSKGKLPSKSSSPIKLPSKSSSPIKLITRHSENVNETSQKCCCESGTCIKNLKDLLDKEMEYRQAQAMQSIDLIKQEKEYYMKEYHKALEQMRNVPTHDRSENVHTTPRTTQEVLEYKQQLEDQEMLIKELEKELTNIKSLLPGRSEFYGAESPRICNNPNCKRREREVDIKTKDLTHMELENNTLKSKLQALNETTVFNEERMKKAFQDMEAHIRKLEDERKDLVKTEVTHRSNISQLEQDYKNAKDQLRQTQNELNNQKAAYNQLKLLHEQTDRALSDAQAQVIRVETELVNYQSKAKDSSRNTAAHDREVSKLSSDVQIMRNQLTKLDREKDELLNNLDEKTERIAGLEDDLSSKNKSIAKLEGELKELRRKLSKYADDTSNKDQLVRSSRQQLEVLENDYEKEKRLKESALVENRRLQGDLTALTCDCRDARNELEISKRQVEDLKRQLQHYVAEVKRTEDLISNKELERTELLDQFRCLSQEANILESNNHTLENEATQTKVQLSVALDHTSDLERRLENQESIIKSYERQISELTSLVARLEVQLKQTNKEQEQYNTEINQMRDLCVKLDKDKDNLKHELYSKEDRRSKVERNTEKLESEKETLQRALDKERASLDAVEKLLNEARQELIEQRLLNQDIQNEVGRLKQKITELEERLTITSEQLDIYQCKALEYSQLNKQLRREIANERFSKARTDDKGPSADKPEVRHKRLTKERIHFSETLEKRQNGPPNGAQSNISTNTLSASKEYHGSSGIIGGVIDLTKLENEPTRPLKRIISAVSTKTITSDNNKYHGSDGVLDGAIDLTALDDEWKNDPLAIVSTKTLESLGQYHGSDGLIRGTIDLTTLDQETLECHEECDKFECPLYKDLFLSDDEKEILMMITPCDSKKSSLFNIPVPMSPPYPNIYRGSYETFGQKTSPLPSPPPTDGYHASYEVFHDVKNLDLVRDGPSQHGNNTLKKSNVEQEIPVRSLDGVEENVYSKGNKKRSSYMDKDVSKIGSPLPTSPPQTNGYHGSYEIFGQATNPPKSQPLPEGYHASYEMFNEVKNVDLRNDSKNDRNRLKNEKHFHRGPIQTNGVKKGDFEKSNGKKSHYLNKEVNKIGSPSHTSPPQPNGYHGSYEIFGQSTNPPKSRPLPKDYHASYEVFNEVNNVDLRNDSSQNGSKNKTVNERSLNLGPIQTNDVKRGCCKEGNGITDKPSCTSKPSSNIGSPVPILHSYPNDYHGSYEIFGQVPNHPKPIPPPEGYHASYEVFNEVHDVANPPRNDPSQKSHFENNNFSEEIPLIPSLIPTYYDSNGFKDNCLERCIKRKCLSYVTFSDNSDSAIENNRTKDLPTSILCSGVKNKPNINNQKDNLCFGNKCLDLTKLSRTQQSALGGVTAEVVIPENSATRPQNLGTSTIRSSPHHTAMKKNVQSLPVQPYQNTNVETSQKPRSKRLLRGPSGSNGLDDEDDDYDKSSEEKLCSRKQTSIEPQYSENPRANGRKHRASRDEDNQKLFHKKSGNISPNVSYDIVWNKCKCQECFSNASVSEPNIQGKCLSKGLSATNKCTKKHASEKTKIVKDVSKSSAEKDHKQEDTHVSSKVTSNKHIDMISDEGCVRSDKSSSKSNTASSKKHEHVEQVSNKLPSVSGTHSKAEFSQNSDESAVFRKVFSINGVGLQCHCCISSFKSQE